MADLAAVASGSHTATLRVADLISASSGDQRADLLDAVASAAAGGNAPSRDLLVAITAQLGLARPAIASVTSNADLRAEIEQIVLAAVAHSIGGFEGRSRYTTWLHRLARNRAITAAQRRVDGPAPLDPTTIDCLERGIDQRRMSSLASERQVVRQAIDALPDTYRAVVVLRDLHGLSYTDIADRLDLELNTVRSRLARGRALLAEALGGLDS